MPRASSYHLTPALLAAHAGEQVLCLAAQGVGRTFALYEERPGAERNAPVRADLPSGAAHVISPVAETPPSLICVMVMGPLMQRAGFVEGSGLCSGGWIDGHDAVCERLCAALAEGDVLLVVDSPGGAAAGLQQAVAMVLDAKAKYGRRITVWANEMIGSAAVWWAFAVGDEVFIPDAGQVGSIGARGGHLSTAGAMAQAGLVMTYFADPPEKVALAPEYPLTEVGAARGMRDVRIAADAFRAAICASPRGVAAGLTPEGLIALGADMLTGVNAVAGGLADAVSTLPAVTEYALMLASSGEAKATTDTAAKAATTGAMRATGDRAMSLQAEKGAEPDDEPDDPNDDDEPVSERGIDIPSKCASCSVENDADAKFCKGCGESMATKPTDETAAGDEPPPSSKPAPKPGLAAGDPPKMSAPARLPQSASLASILGAKGSDDVSIKTAALRARQAIDTLVGLTGKADIGESIGAALNIPAKIARGAQAIADLAKSTAAAEGAERWALAHRLVKVGAIARDKVLADVIDDNGKRTLDANGKPVVRIRSRYAAMDLGVFRGMVTDLEGDAPKRRTTPFEPSREAAEAAKVDATGAMPADGKPTKAMIERAKKDPTVLKMFHQPGNKHAIETIAEQYIIAAHANGLNVGGAA